MPFTQSGPEVLLSVGEVTVIGAAEIARVKALASASPRGRARICAHPGPADPLHEMILVLAGRRYIRPHAHVGKSESFHMIEGRLSVVLFGDGGALDRVIDLDAAGGDGARFYRLAAPIYHTVVPWTAEAVYHETTNGPFEKADTRLAPWAPDEADEAAGAAWLDRLIAEIGDRSRT